jgi:hypothetical protein
MSEIEWTWREEEEEEEGLEDGRRSGGRQQDLYADAGADTVVLGPVYEDS